MFYGSNGMTIAKVLITQIPSLLLHNAIHCNQNQVMAFAETNNVSCLLCMADMRERERERERDCSYRNRETCSFSTIY
jgi:hypothetical protein